VRQLLTVLFTTLIANICSEIENLSLCSSAEAGIVLNLFLNFEQKCYKNAVIKIKCVQGEKLAGS